MKKIALLFVWLAAAANLLVSCSDDDSQPQPTVCPPEPEVAVSLNTVVVTSYETGTAQDCFGVMLSTGETVFDYDEGIYHTEQEGYVLTLSLYAAPAADPAAPRLPASRYTLAEKAAPGVWSSENTVCNLIEYKPGQQIGTIVPHTGEVTVAVADGVYTLAVHFATESGKIYNATYSGKLAFQGQSAGGTVLEQPVNAEFVGGQALYFGADESFAEYGTARIEMWDDENDPLAGDVRGNFVKLKIYFDLPTEAFTSIPAGVYHIGPNVGAFMAEPGHDNGVDIPTGCYIAQTLKDRILFGMLSSGTIEVSPEGYVKLDAQTAEGVAVRGRLQVPLEVQNLSGGSPVEPSGPISTLTEDVTINLSGAASAEFLDYGDYFENGTRNVVLNILDEKSLTFMAIDLVLPQADEWAPLPDCTCTVGDESYTAYTFMPCTLQFGSPVGTYYSNLVAGEGGTYAIGDLMGAAAQGTVKIARTEGDLYTLEFDLVDDVPLSPHAIRGSWSGTLQPFSYGDVASIAKRAGR